MRILHSSDWHLGQHFFDKSRLPEHRAFFDWLLTQVVAHQVDAVLVAGDIFDTGAPPSYARELYNQLVLEMRAAGAALVLLGGNHDSVAMLGESRQLLAQLGTQVIPGVMAEPQQQVLTLNRRDGRPGAVLCAIPFLRARDLQRSAAGQSAEQKQASLQAAIAEHYRQIYQLALRQREAAGLPLPIIATGHLTTVGASASESVREIYVGALEAFPTAAFPPADYVALGHIHRPQTVGGQSHIRYSGSPIPLSFDEAGQTKQVLLVDFAEGRLADITVLPVPRSQPLASVRGSLRELADAIPAAAGEVPAGQVLWLDVTVASDDYLTDLATPVGKLCQGLPVELLRLRRARGQAQPGWQAQTRETLDELSPADVFERRLAAETLEEGHAEALRALHRQLLAALAEPGA